MNQERLKNDLKAKIIQKHTKSTLRKIKKNLIMLHIGKDEIDVTNEFRKQLNNVRVYQSTKLRKIT